MSIAEEILDSKSEVLSFLNLKNWQSKEFRSYGKNWDRKLQRLKIHQRQLVIDNKESREWMKYIKGARNLSKLDGFQKI